MRAGQLEAGRAGSTSFLSRCLPGASATLGHPVPPLWGAGTRGLRGRPACPKSSVLSLPGLYMFVCLNAKWRCLCRSRRSSTAAFGEEEGARSGSRQYGN